MTAARFSIVINSSLASNASDAVSGYDRGTPSSASSSIASRASCQSGSLLMGSLTAINSFQHQHQSATSRHYHPNDSPLQRSRPPPDPSRPSTGGHGGRHWEALAVSTQSVPQRRLERAPGKPGCSAAPL